MTEEAPIREGDLVVIPVKSRRFETYLATGQVVSICGKYCKVSAQDFMGRRFNWFGFISDVRRSYATPNPRPE